MLRQSGREAVVNSQLEEPMSERLTLPVLPLREIVLFPGVSTPIGAGRPTTLRAIEAALKGDSRLIFGVSQRENVDHVTPAVLYTTGTIAKISQIQRGLGGVQLLLHGEKRGAAVHYVENQGHLEAVVREVEDLPPLRPDDPAFVGLHREARERAAELGQKSGLPEEVVRQVLEGVSDPGRLADLVAGYLEIDPAERQALLETLEVEERLRRVLVHVQRQIGVLDAQEHIKSQVQEELGERQRELFLREQMKAIRKELGEGDEASDVEELRKRLAALELPEAAQKEVDREVERPGDGPAVRAHLAGRRPGRGRHPRPSPHLRRRDAGPHHPGDEAGRSQEPRVPARRSRQAGRLVPGRPGGGAAGSARSGAERLVYRSLPRGAVRPVGGAVRRDRELAAVHPRAA